ncbi:hypothetical protein TEA_016560 [Camellia sinensis var. sinensis]|uniref:Uncharacterized protein n=1 Tax=Camellia sinensis var. sinensis TaxID=542762 RepID=A0A4S4D779_CAMSN|nr:hypothetical protein TEA_016560 [Camellia sinensis var. sinensis]
MNDPNLAVAFIAQMTMLITSVTNLRQLEVPEEQDNWRENEWLDAIFGKVETTKEVPTILVVNEQDRLAEAYDVTSYLKINNSKHTQSHSSKSSPRSSSSQAQDHLAVSRLESFEMPMSDDSSEKKLSWLRSQIIGGDVEFESPFGKRRLTKADHTASGRCLHYIENHIINNVLPFYAIKRLQEVMGIAIPSTMRERVLKCLQISSSEERWVVFVGPYEHHSNILSWRQSLAEVVEIGLDETDNGLINMEAPRLQLIFYHKQANVGFFLSLQYGIPIRIRSYPIQFTSLVLYCMTYFVVNFMFVV